jgi:hypothetical protein
MKRLRLEFSIENGAICSFFAGTFIGTNVLPVDKPMPFMMPWTLGNFDSFRRGCFIVTALAFPMSISPNGGGEREREKGFGYRSTILQTLKKFIIISTFSHLMIVE